MSTDTSTKPATNTTNVPANGPAGPTVLVPSGSRLAQIWADLKLAARGTKHDYTQGPIGRAIFLLAVPMVLEMVMESIFAVVDMFWVAKLGAAAVATVALTESMMAIVYTLAFGLAIGTTATVARRIGEKNPDGAARAAVQAITLGVIVSGTLGVLGAVFAGDLLRLMGAGPDVLEHGVGFARVMLGGSASVFLLFVINAASAAPATRRWRCACCGSRMRSTSCLGRSSSSASARFPGSASRARPLRQRLAGRSAC